MIAVANETTQFVFSYINKELVLPTLPKRISINEIMKFRH